MKAYHFLKEDMKSSYGNEPPWNIGEERTIEGDIRLCVWGYHSSRSWYDALQYAPGSMACIVDVPTKRKGTIVGNDKQVSPKKKLVDAKDASRVLRLFACDCAERALKKTNITDKRSWEAIRISRLYAEGKASKAELGAARYASYYAARNAADAANYAAHYAANAARYAANYAARNAAMDAEIRWQKRRLNWYMKRLFESR